VSFQNLFEALAEFIDRQVVQGSMGDAGRHWASLLLTLFFFILFGNLLGLVPLPTHFKPATANLNVTAALASIVFTVVLALNLRRHGLLGFLKKFVPPGLPWGVALLVAPVEVLSWLAKPVSLAIRLFANMMAGHALIFVFVAMEMSAAWLLVPFPVVGAVIMNCFEIFVCFIQAFVFTLLAGIYIRDAMEEAA
jgi:F-type H+-transporting ATPase subunit a